MKRWLALLFGLGMVALAGYALLTGAPPPQAADGLRPGVGGPAEVRGVPRPHGEIDQRTESRLEDLLRAADREGIE